MHLKLNNYNIALLSSLILLTNVGSIFSQDFFAELNIIKGVVELKKSTDDVWSKAINGMPIESNDTIRTSADSYCYIDMDDSSIIKLLPNTNIKINLFEFSNEKNNSSFFLWFGKLLASISKTKTTKMQISTPVSVASVRGTDFAIETNEIETNIGVFDGEIVVNNPHLQDIEEVVLKSEEETTVKINSKPEKPKKLQEIMKRNKELLSEIREKRKILKERLKNTPSIQRFKNRKEIFERFKDIKEKRIQRIKNIKEEKSLIKKNLNRVR